MAFAKVENMHLKFLASNQSAICADLYQNVDAVAASDHDQSVGQRVILPATFTGSPCDMHRHYQDAIATVRKYGKPDYFITVTCNPAWPDINEALLPGQNAADQPDIVARVFRGQLNKLLHEIVEDSIFGR